MATSHQNSTATARTSLCLSFFRSIWFVYLLVLLVWVPLYYWVSRPEPGEVRRFLGYDGGARKAAFSPDGRYVLSASDDNILRLWEVATGREIRRMTTEGLKPSARLSALVFVSDRHALSGGLDRDMQLWDLEGGKQLRSFLGPSNGASAIAVSPGGECALSVDYTHGDVLMWDIQTGRLASVLLRAMLGIEHLKAENVCFAPDGNRFVINTQAFFLIWDPKTGKEVRRFDARDKSRDKSIDPVNQHFVFRVLFTPDARHLISCGWDGTWRLWDAETGKEVRRIQAHNGFVRHIALSRDGTRLVSGGDDNMVKVWDMQGREIKRFAGHRKFITSVDISPDGRYVLSASRDGSLRLWELTE